jgi:leucyl-tRNA synthetase
MILGANGIKMGKRYPEFAVDPNDIVRDYGADTIRLYEMFMGPIEANKPWNVDGVEGAKRFIDRVYRIFEEKEVSDKENKNLEKVYHQTVKKVTEDLDRMQFNTAISQIMILVNAIYKESQVPTEYASGLIKMLNPFAPFVTEEVWNTFLGHDGSITYEPWPTFDADKAVSDEISLPVQVNGKLRSNVMIEKDEEEASVKEKVYADEKIKAFIDGKTIVKEIYVQNRIYNIVIK